MTAMRPPLTIRYHIVRLQDDDLHLQLFKILKTIMEILAQYNRGSNVMSFKVGTAAGYLLQYGFYYLNTEPFANGSSNEFGVGVGVVLDVDSLEGKLGLSYLSMAHDDFYAAHKSYKTKLVLHVRDSKGHVVDTAASALDLLKEVKVNAIIAPQKSSQASILIEMGDKAQVPIISFSPTIPCLQFPPPNRATSYLIQTSQSDATQIGAIVAIVKAFPWRQVVFIFEDTDCGLPPYLANALHDINVQVSYRSIISLSSTDDFILKELYKMMTMQTKVFIVQVSPSLATRLFLRAKEIRMMSEGYAWIITSGLMDLLCSLSMDSPGLLESMQGVLGVRPLIPQSDKLESFTSMWKRRFLQNNTSIKQAEASIFGLWAYDTLWALAMAAERVAIKQQQVTAFRDFSKPVNSTDPFDFGFSKTGPKLLQEILDTRFRGVAGDFHLSNGQLQPSAYQILNIVGNGEREVGIWTPPFGITRDLKMLNINNSYSISKDNLRAIIWPGESVVVPQGWEIPVTGKMLKIGVPVKEGFTEFVKVERDPRTNSVKVTGFCIHVFDSIIKLLPYPVLYEYVPYDKDDGTSAGNYNDLVHEVFLQNFDAAVGDITVTTNRSMYVDFTIPYTEGGIYMIVPIRHQDWDDKWTFLKPLKSDLWLTSIAFFILTGAAVWILEHRINTAFRGPPSQHVGMLFYFPFSTLVFAHREQIVSNLARLVVVVWIFVVLILNSTYTASLSSRLTAQRFEPAFSDVHQLLNNKHIVGYEMGSFVDDILRRLGFEESNLKPYVSDEECTDALNKGSQNGGISAFFSAGAHTKIFFSKYCEKYMVVGPIYHTGGFAFALPKGSPLLADVSRAVINMIEGSRISQLEKLWFSYEPKCTNPEDRISSDGVKLGSFLGLFAITGGVTGICLVVYFVHFTFKNKEDLQRITSSSPTTWSGVCGICKYFDQRDQQWHSFYKDGHLGCQNNHQQCCQHLHGICLVPLQTPQSPISPSISNSARADSHSDRADEDVNDEIRPHQEDAAPMDHV